MRILRSVPTAAETPIALTIGNFDGVHLGHQAMLSRLRDTARAEGLPACAMTFEPHPREFFAPDQAPARLTSLREKLELLAGEGVERAHVLRFDYGLAQITAEDFVERILVRGLGVRRLLVGDDFRFGARRAGDFALLKACSAAHAFTVEAMTSVTLEGERVSSTAVRKALEHGDLAQAARLLGRPYSISGAVVHGDGVGKQLGFPTANVRIRHNRPPLTGIFAVEVSGAADAPLRGVASLGVRPTVKQQGQPVLEVYLLDFSGDIYGRHVRVDFLHKFRDEEKFADLAALTRQIATDVRHTREYFERMDRARGAA
ncbi:MAG: ribF [Betaproteobacteria bacterium]|nr:ribF [Betaproteobacteria bacterium]